MIVHQMWTGKGDLGFNAARKEYVDLVEKGVILLGSLAESVVRNASYPVLTIRS